MKSVIIKFFLVLSVLNVQNLFSAAAPASPTAMADDAFGRIRGYVNLLYYDSFEIELSNAFKNKNHALLRDIFNKIIIPNLIFSTDTQHICVDGVWKTNNIDRCKFLRIFLKYFENPLKLEYLQIIERKFKTKRGLEKTLKEIPDIPYPKNIPPDGFREIVEHCYNTRLAPIFAGLKEYGEYIQTRENRIFEIMCECLMREKSLIPIEVCKIPTQYDEYDELAYDAWRSSKARTEAVAARA